MLRKDPAVKMLDNLDAFVARLEKRVKAIGVKNTKNAAKVWSPADDVSVYWQASPTALNEVDKELKIVLRHKGGKVALHWLLTLAQGKSLYRQLKHALTDIKLMDDARKDPDA